MANLKSSKKDLRRIAKKRAQNVEVRTSLKTYIKKARTAPDAAVATDALKVAVAKLDKAVQNGQIHKNQAARRKSRVAKQVNKLAAK